jgi:hypothetical protein
MVPYIAMLTGLWLWGATKTPLYGVALRIDCCGGKKDATPM